MTRRTAILGLVLTLAASLLATAALAAPALSPVQASSVRASRALAQVALTPGEVTLELCASDGTITMPDAVDVDVWGFVPTPAGGCTTGLVDGSTFPGPEIHLVTGDDVTIVLTNALDRAVSIVIPGQDVSATGDPGMLTAEAPSGGSATYGFTAREGTFVYESGTDGSVQVPMGLYGAMVVSSYADEAYGTPYDAETVLLLSEIDPDLNAAPDGFDLLGYHPTYWLINGKAYPNTAPIAADPGDRVLVRYANAGFTNLSMALLGTYQRVIARQAYAVPNPYDAVAEVIPAGATADVMIDTAGLTGPAPIYNRNEHMVNVDAFPGGMLTFLTVDAPIGDPPVVTITSPADGAKVSGTSVGVAITATDTEDDASSTALTVDWTVDGGTTWTPAATWDTTTVPDGLRTLTARAIDSDGNETTDSVTVTVDNVPDVSFTPLADAVVFGDTAAISIDATDNDDAAGSLGVTWRVDAGAPTAATWNGTTGRYEAAWDTTGLTDGPHTITVEATDSDANTGSAAAQVFVSNQPTATLVSPVDGGSVSGTVLVAVDAADAEDDASPSDGRALTVTWDVDGGTPATAALNPATGRYEAVWDTGSAGVGAHMLNVYVTDSRGNLAVDTPGDTVSASVSVEVTANSVHVGNLVGSAALGGGPNWTAYATATVHTVNHTGVPGAMVTFEVTRYPKNGAPDVRTYICTTDAGGSCTVSRSVNANQYDNAVDFVVVGVSSAAAYDPALNHDGTGTTTGLMPTISVERP